MLTRGPFRIGAGVATGGALNRAHPLNVGLVGRWLVLPGRMAGPTWYDLAGSTNGTLTGGATWRATSRPGGAGELRFDGSTGYVNLGASPTLNLHTAPATLVFSVRFPATPTTDSWAVSRDSDTLGRAFAIGYDSSGGPNNVVMLQVNGALTLAVGSSAPVAGRWYRVALVATPSTWLLYLDGVLGNSAAYVQPATTTGPTLIGRRSYSGFEGYMNGSVDDVAFYNRALSAAEVAALYSLSLRGYPGLLNRSGVSSPALFGAVASTATTFSFAATLAGVSLSAALTATAPASSALTLAPTLANATLTSSFTAAAPASSAITCAATLAGMTLASSFTSSTPGATSATLAPTLADVALASSYTATAAGGSSLSLAPTLAAATLSATLTATAPAASSFSAPATLADLTLASSFTASAVGASAFAVAPTLADVALASSFATATPASSSVAVSATLAAATLASTFTASAVGDSAFTVAGTIGVALAATLAAARPAASALTYAATLADVALAALLSATGPGSSSLALAATLADCTASLHLTAAGGIVAAGAHPDAGRSTGVRLGPDPSRSSGRRLGPDPSRSTGAVT